MTTLKQLEGKEFKLSEEVRYIQQRAAEYDARVVSVGSLVFLNG